MTTTRRTAAGAGGVRRTVPWWSVVSAAAAPVLLIGGWRLAATRQPGGFDPAAETISALAARGATDRWIMSTALAGVGGCHVVTALGLRDAAVPGRALLAAGGLATLAVAALPQPVTGDSAAHVAAAGVAFPALSLWPAAAWPPGRPATPPMPAVATAATAALLALLGRFGVEFSRHGPRLGFAERLLAGAQALWPAAAVLLARRRRCGPMPPDPMLRQTHRGDR